MIREDYWWARISFECNDSSVLPSSTEVRRWVVLRFVKVIGDGGERLGKRHDQSRGFIANVVGELKENVLEPGLRCIGLLSCVRVSSIESHELVDVLDVIGAPLM